MRGWTFLTVSLGFGFRERVPLLSKIPGDPTVGSFRVEKENCSTHRGLHVGTNFGSF